MRFLRGLKIFVMVLAFVAIAGVVVERLWNWLVPSIFHLRAITYWEAMGLLLLSKLLLGGFHRHGGGGRWSERREWKRRMKARWSSMTPEERRRFREGMRQWKQEMKSQWRCGPRRDAMREAAAPAAAEREAR